MTHSIARHVRLLTIAVLAAGCTGGKEAPKVPLATARADSAHAAAGVQLAVGDAAATGGGVTEGPLSAPAMAAIDSANALFRKKQYALALSQYRTAGVLVPQHAAPLFGVYMVAQATKDSKLADSALAEIRKRNGELPPAMHEFTDSASLKAGARKGVNGMTRY